MSADRTLDALARLRAPLYALGILLVLFPLADLITNIWPLRAGSLEWRYGVLGLTPGFFLTPMLGLAILAVEGIVAEDGLPVRIVGWIAMSVGVLMLVAMAIFLFDMLQFRPNVPEEQRWTFDMGAWKSILKYLITGPILFLMGRGVLKVAPR